MIAGEIERCAQCKKGKTGLPVPGEGDEHAKVMFIGMAPGKEEAKTGRPFVGRSGKLLTELLESIGIRRKDVYITSPVKYYPGNRNLKKSEIRHGTVHLLKQIKAVSPGIIVLMGNVAVQALLPDEKIRVTKDHGRFIGKYFITFHPAAALRFPRIRRIMEKDFNRLKHKLP